MLNCGGIIPGFRNRGKPEILITENTEGHGNFSGKLSRERKIPPQRRQDAKSFKEVTPFSRERRPKFAGIRADSRLKTSFDFAVKAFAFFALKIRLIFICRVKHDE
ncbi:hypothetical protein [Candidatus Spyradosoma sp. SGI.093]|uniref:hypothetical protein n=1 Tax=Candidatus Spyradosoma sp. SGI.093 TaxID=3420583 RepID=UPI003CFD8A21